MCEYIDSGRSTGMLISALKFRFNECEKRGFSFRQLNKPSEQAKPHNIIPTAMRTHIDQALHDDISMRIACRMLYELAARC